MSRQGPRIYAGLSRGKAVVVTFQPPVAPQKGDSPARGGIREIPTNEDHKSEEIQQKHEISISTLQQWSQLGSN
ncbi:hypothetical protein PsorP6_017473 [Peronosclerospora sorghi]|uniref:Uncharacterized protein n=1 Tax=Peronosclerospora sorghi TaxID=230839 RepID=A0ACC0WM40_9STRA|nr:hypothetical protein PsorP6_017473 [Peronosclerospora sorghi]